MKWSLRDTLWLFVIAGLVLGWIRERSNTAHLRRLEIGALYKEVNEAEYQSSLARLRTESILIPMEWDGYRVELNRDSISVHKPKLMRVILERILAILEEILLQDSRPAVSDNGGTAGATDSP